MLDANIYFSLWMLLSSLEIARIRDSVIPKQNDRRATNANPSNDYRPTSNGDISNHLVVERKVIDEISNFNRIFYRSKKLLLTCFCLYSENDNSYKIIFIYRRHWIEYNITWTWIRYYKRFVMMERNVLFELWFFLHISKCIECWMRWM